MIAVELTVIISVVLVSVVLMSLFILMYIEDERQKNDFFRKQYDGMGLIYHDGDWRRPMKFDRK